MTMTDWATVAAAMLVGQTLLLIPMVPGKLIDTRDFAPLPRWQYTSFNVFLSSLGLVSFIMAGLLLANVGWAFAVTAVLAVLFGAVFLSDLLEVFPVVPDRMPVQLLVLEAISLASAGGLLVVALRGALTAGGL